MQSSEVGELHEHWGVLLEHEVPVILVGAVRMLGARRLKSGLKYRFKNLLCIWNSFAFNSGILCIEMMWKESRDAHEQL